MSNVKFSCESKSTKQCIDENSFVVNAEIKFIVGSVLLVELHRLHS